MATYVSYIVLQTIAMGLTALLLPGLRVTSIFGAIGAVIALSVINATIWDAGLFFQLPSAVTTQSVILLVANAVLFWIVAKILPGVEIDGIVSALLAPLVFTVMSVLVLHFGKEVDWVTLFKRTVGEVEQLRDQLKDSNTPGAVTQTPSDSAAPDTSRP